MSDDWYYLSSHGHVGPLSLEELKETLASFQNGQDVPVWREGFANWRKAGDVPEIDAETPLPPPIGTGRDGAADPKLPLWNTICLSYSSYFRNFPDVLRISWLWLAVVAPLMGIMSRLQLSWVAGVQADMKGGMPPQQMLASKPVETMVLGTIAILVFAFAGVSIAVAWHRRIILRELPGFSGSNVATKGLWRYVWMGFAIGLIVFLPLLVIVLSMFLLLSPVAKAGTPWSLIPIPMIFLLWLAGLAVTLRLSLLLPARAVGDLDLTFKRTWKRTSGNTWRIFWGIVACTIPPMLALQLPVQIVSSSFLALSHGTSDGDATVGVAAISAILFASNLLTLPIGIGFMSYSYWYFFERT